VSVLLTHLYWEYFKKKRNLASTVEEKFKKNENYLVADDGEHFVSASLFLLGQDGQDAAQRAGGWPRHRLSGLLVEMGNVEGVLEHLAELAIVNTAVRTPVETDDALAVIRYELGLLADSQLEGREELAFRDSATAQTIVVLEELGRPDPASVDGNLSTVSK